METKYNIGDYVQVYDRVDSINITEDGAKYHLKYNDKWRGESLLTPYIQSVYVVTEMVWRDEDPYCKVLGVFESKAKAEKLLLAINEGDMVDAYVNTLKPSVKATLMDSTDDGDEYTVEWESPRGEMIQTVLVQYGISVQILSR